jgi:hypothetical protein
MARKLKRPGRHDPVQCDVQHVRHVNYDRKYFACSVKALQKNISSRAAALLASLSSSSA